MNQTSGKRALRRILAGLGMVLVLIGLLWALFASLPSREGRAYVELVKSQPYQTYREIERIALWDGGAEIALVGSAAITLTQDTLYTEEGKTIPVADLAPGNMLRVSGEDPNIVHFGADTLRQPVYLTYAADAMPTSQTLIAGPDETINITP